MKRIILNELSKLRNKTHVDKKVLNKFLQRISFKQKLIEKDSPKNHICSFFLPIDLKTNSIYLVHHIKANDWIPPGGHIEQGETPVQTVKREFIEELKYKLTTEKIRLFDLSIIKIINQNYKCKTHYDFWYLVFINRQDFRFDKKEAYDASWFEFDKVLKKVKRKEYNLILKKLFKSASDNTLFDL